MAQNGEAIEEIPCGLGVSIRLARVRFTSQDQVGAFGEDERDKRGAELIRTGGRK